MEQHKHLNFQSMTLKKFVGGLIVICCIGLGLVGCGSSTTNPDEEVKKTEVRETEMDRLIECIDAHRDFLKAMEKEDFSSAVYYYDSGYRKLKSFYPTDYAVKVQKEKVLKLYEDRQSKELYNYAKKKSR